MVFHSDCTILHSNQQYKGVQFFYILDNLLFCVLYFLILTILLGVKWNLIVVLICNSPMLSDVWHFFSCAYCPFLYLLWRYMVYLSPLPIFLIGLLFAVWFLHIFWIWIPFQLCNLQMFFIFHGFRFYSLDTVLWCTKVYSFDEVQFYLFLFFCYLCFWYHI